jgi:hypothetical protein
MEPVTGDAPPGQTPRTEGNPWSLDPDAAWWRGDGYRGPAEALTPVESGAAASHDGTPEAGSQAGSQAEPAKEAAEPVAVERDHHQQTRDRYEPPADGRRGQPPRRKPRAPHRAGPGLIALITLGFVAAFFSWVSAEPFWLAVGHGDPGVATVERCSGSGVVQRCTARSRRRTAAMGSGR